MYIYDRIIVCNKPVVTCLFTALVNKQLTLDLNEYTFRSHFFLTVPLFEAVRQIKYCKSRPTVSFS